MSRETELRNEGVVVDGEVSVSQLRRPPIKLADKPQIVVAMPVGDKHAHTLLECDKNQGGCGLRWQAAGARVPATIPVQFMLSHMNWVPPLNVAMSYLCQFGMLSAQARQIMTKEAIRIGAKYVFYVDDDTLVPPLGLYTLHNFLEQNPQIGAVSGVYTTRENPNEPLVYKQHGVGAYWDFPMGPKATPVPILGAGAGCLLARVEAIVDTIDRLKEEHGGVEVPVWADSRTIPADLAEQNQLKTRKVDEEDDSDKERRIMWGHDVRFCRELNKTGWPVYVDGRVMCGHYDIESGETFYVPDTAPGFKIARQKNINTAEYWDRLYSEEGVHTWRQYPEMFGKVVNAVADGADVVELGCGVGVLGSRLTAQKQVKWRGYDISEEAATMAQARFLSAEALDVAALSKDHIGAADTVVATELVEHLDEAVFHHVVDTVDQTQVKTMVLTIPDNCMGPEEVPEHTALFSEELLRERFEQHPGWELKFQKADDAHLLCVAKRKD